MTGLYIDEPNYFPAKPSMKPRRGRRSFPVHMQPCKVGCQEIDPFEFKAELQFEYIHGHTWIALKDHKQSYHVSRWGLTLIIPHMIKGIIRGNFGFEKHGDWVYLYLKEPLP